MDYVYLLVHYSYVNDKKVKKIQCFSNKSKAENAQILLDVVWIRSKIVKVKVCKLSLDLYTSLDTGKYLTY